MSHKHGQVVSQIEEVRLVAMADVVEERARAFAYSSSRLVPAGSTLRGGLECDPRIELIERTVGLA